MNLNKNILLILLSLALLAGAIAFNYIQKKEFKENLDIYTNSKEEVTNIKKLQKTWNIKGVSKKINLALSTIKPNKKSITLKRKKAVIKLKSLTDKELNYAISKLASLPLQFKELNINKNGDNFNMECLCVW